jgi:ribosomal protein S27AE
MNQKRKLVCAKCGAEMNNHASKIDYDFTYPELIDPAFGGVLKDAHYCPQCGNTELTPAN